MYIAKIVLRDWKAFETASFDFPAPTDDKNVILIGAPNGYGKTSLFEAIVLCLFGQDGMTLIGRESFLRGDRDRPKESYTNYLQRALHYQALDQGRRSCSVQLTFIDDDDQIEINRTWHYSDSGALRPKDEEVIIYEGLHRSPVGPEESDSIDRMEWYRDYIGKHLIPSSLAYFFLFDGEQVSELAEREMSAQVRGGIEGLLGIPILKSMAHDLRTYAGTRRRESPSGGDKTLSRMERELASLQTEVKEVEEHLESVRNPHQRLENDRNTLMRELSGFGAGSQALLQELYEQIKEIEKTRETLRTELEALLTKEFSFSLVGSALRSELKFQLRQESALKNWERGKSQGDSNLDEFITAMTNEVRNIVPPLTQDQHSAVLEISRRTWGQLWYPPPDGCSDGYLHPYLSDLDRSKLDELLTLVDAKGSRRVMELMSKISQQENRLTKLREEIHRTESIGPKIDEKRRELADVNERIQKLDKEIGATNNKLHTLRGMESQKNKEYSRLAHQLDQAKPSVRRFTRALEVAEMVDDIVSKAVPSQIEAVANEMTQAHKAMAHKKDLVERVSVDDDCNVQLLSSSGIDVRGFDLSAGEKQVFTQSLIWAVSSVSGRYFPMLIDTPLGRLDVDHRKGVLKHFSRRKQQIILLSTNTEVVGEYLDTISPHVQRRFLLQFERNGDAGRTIVHKDTYFQSEEKVS